MAWPEVARSDFNAVCDRDEPPCNLYPNAARDGSACTGANGALLLITKLLSPQALAALGAA